MKDYKVKVQYQLLEEERRKAKREEISILIAYWIVAVSSFVWIPCLAVPFTGMRLIVSVVVVVLSTILLWCVTYIGTKRDWKAKLIVSTVVLALLVTLFLSWFTTASFGVRYVFSALSVAFFVGSFDYILYFDDLSPRTKVNMELLHTRYLEYGRTLFWLILITLSAYITWEFSVIGRSDVETGSTWRAGVLGLLQISSVFAGGGIITIIAFDRKLRQIEHLTKQD